MSYESRQHKPCGAEASAGEERREEEKKDVCTYIHTLLTKQTNKQTKTRINIVIPEDIDQATEILAALLHTTKSNLASEGLLEHLEDLVERLPSTVQLNIVHQLEAKPDSGMLDLEVDMAGEELLSVVQRLKKLKATSEWHDSTPKRFLLERLKKLLPKTIRLAERSGNEEFCGLVFEAREFLRGEV